MAWGRTHSLKSSPGHGASPDPATATTLACGTQDAPLDVFQSSNKSQNRESCTAPRLQPSLAQDPQAGLCRHRTGTLPEPKPLCPWGQDVPLQGWVEQEGTWPRALGY